MSFSNSPLGFKKETSPNPFAFDLPSPAIDPSIFQFSPEPELSAWTGFIEGQASPLSHTQCVSQPRQRSHSNATWTQAYHPYFTGLSARPRSLMTSPPSAFNAFRTPTSISPMSSPGCGVSPTTISPPLQSRRSTRDHIDSDDALGIGKLITRSEDSPRRKHGPEDTRIMRIESEQRRRDELREGFKRLREALPPTNQRASKANLLDRSVAHIQSVESANHYLLAQLETATKELEMLRMQNHNLVQAVARSGGITPSSL